MSGCRYNRGQRSSSSRGCRCRRPRPASSTTIRSARFRVSVDGGARLSAPVGGVRPRHHLASAVWISPPGAGRIPRSASSSTSKPGVGDHAPCQRHRCRWPAGQVSPALASPRCLARRQPGAERPAWAARAAAMTCSSVASVGRSDVGPHRVRRTGSLSSMTIPIRGAHGVTGHVGDVRSRRSAPTACGRRTRASSSGAWFDLHDPRSDHGDRLARFEPAATGRASKNKRLGRQ